MQPPSVAGVLDRSKNPWTPLTLKNIRGQVVIPADSLRNEKKGVEEETFLISIIIVITCRRRSSGPAKSANALPSTVDGSAL